MELINLILLMAAFGVIVAWVFARQRKKPFEQDARIPFQDKDG